MRQTTHPEETRPRTNNNDCTNTVRNQSRTTLRLISLLIVHNMVEAKVVRYNPSGTSSGKLQQRCSNL